MIAFDRYEMCERCAEVRVVQSNGRDLLCRVCGHKVNGELRYE